MSKPPTEKRLQGIKAWSEEDRPREKLLQRGRDALSNAELIGILLGSGTKNLSAVDVAKQVLQLHEHNLAQIGKLSVKELCKFEGIGPAKAITLIAAFELGRRRKSAEVQHEKITSSKLAYQYVYPHLADLNHERFVVLLLNRAHRPVKTIHLSRGGQTGTVVDPKMVFSQALQVDAANALLLFHNHPSGNLQPSKEDKAITQKLVEGGKLLDFRVLDHIIVGHDDYLSFADEGLMPQ